MTTTLEDVATALEHLGHGGSFASRRTVDAEHLQLTVKGVGEIAFPLSAETGRELVAQAVQSPFGWRERTVMDRSVRDGWQIAKSRLKIDGRRWNPVLRETVAELAEALGLPASVRLVPKLDKLTIYGPGQFFKPHKDTEKSDAMIGTLVVLLPSRYTGGVLRVERGQQRYEVRRTTRRAPKLDVVAFYADCLHEVRPVKTGYRVALVYALEVQGGGRGVAVGTPGQTEGLRRAVQTYFEETQFRSGFDKTARRPDKLVYLLDHEYTPRNLGWGRLKEADGPRAQALCEVADALGLDAYLCLAKVSETWQCEPEDWGYGRWYGDDDDEDDDDPDDGDAMNPVDLVQSTIALSSWRDRDGSAVAFDGLDVWDSEVCETLPNASLKPAGSEYEGYMGNYGCTLDRWYERAAVVMWPRSRAFAMVVDGDPAGAIQTVLAGLREGATQAQQQLSILVDRIADHRDLQEDHASWLALLALAEVVRDESTARRLLEPFPPSDSGVPLRSAKAVVALLKCYGDAFVTGLIGRWHRDDFRSPGFDVYPVAWVERVARDGGKGGRAVASAIAKGQADDVLSVLDGRERLRSRSPYATGRPREPWSEGEVRSSVRQALAACVAGRARAPFERCVAALTAAQSPLGALDLGQIALALEIPQDAPPWVGRGAKQLLRAAEAELEQLALRADRADGDWSIEIPIDCRCHDCADLHAFLRGPQTIAEMPRNKARRQHLHQQIDAAGLPVEHATRRKGSPYVLVLKKQAALFSRDRALLTKATELLSEVRARL